LKSWLEDKILRRITGDEQFRKNHQVGTNGGGPRASDLFGVARNVTDRGVELCDRDRELVRGTRTHGKPLPLCRSAKQWAGLQIYPYKVVT